jgi:hypothetical protein
MDLIIKTKDESRLRRSHPTRVSSSVTVSANAAWQQSRSRTERSPRLWNKVEGAIAKERAVNAATAAVNPDAQQNDIHSG